MANAMMVILPYQHNGIWVFDDDKTGLVREPFVFGIPEMIDQITAKIPNAERFPIAVLGLTLSWI